MKARKFHPKVRLREIIGEKGGRRIGDVLAEAERVVESLRDRTIEIVDSKIEQLRTIASGEGDIDACYRLSNEIFSESALVKFDEVSRVAHSLCDLLSSATFETFPRAAILVHVDAMRALRAPAMASDRAMRQAVLKELTKLTARARS